MILSSKSEWFIFDSPIGEPNEKWNTNDSYHIERIERFDKSIVWFGCSINWKKEHNGEWQILTTNLDAKPLDKYLPEIIYGSDRTIWVDCEKPIYEKEYEKYYKNIKL
jgi:hypothetical protein